MHRAQHLTFRESILVVDDTPANLRLLASLLADQGYQVRFAPNAKLALKSMQVKLPDLILLDVKLPDLDGYSVCRELKADNRTRNIPVIFLSVLEDPLDKVKAFRVGGADYISKPFQAEEVLARIETQLNTQRLQKQLIDQNLHLQQAACYREKAEGALEQQLQQMRLLQKVTEAIRSPNDSRTIFESVVIEIGRILQIDHCSIHIYVPPPIPEIPLLAEYINPQFDALGKIRFALEDSALIPEVLAQDRAIAVVNVYADPRLQSIQSLCRQADVKSLLTVRTSYRNQPNGVITLQQCSQYRDWTVDEIVLLEAIAAQIGIALAQAKSAEQEQKQLEALGYQNSILRQEICERRQIEAALQASDAELRGLFAAMMDVILVLDRQGCHLRIAPTYQNRLYKPISALLGKTLHEVFPQEQADCFLSHIKNSLDTQQTVDCEYSLVIQSQVIWFSTKISPIGEDTVIWVARDITARKQVEAELLNKSTALSEFSSHLKHLHRLGLTDFISIEDLCADYLKTGCKILGFASGVVGQIIDQKYRLLTVHTDLELLFPGLEFNLQDTYCSAVVQSRQTVCVEQIEQIEQTEQLPNCLTYRSLKIESYLGTPIWVDGEIYGTLCFLSTQARQQGYNNHEKEIIELMAQSIGKFISVHQVKAKRQQAEEEVQLLCNITQAITAASDFNQALHAALSALCQATGWVYGEAWLPSADGSRLQCSPVWYCHQEGQPPAAIAAVKRLRQSIEDVTFQPNEGIAGRVWQQLQLEWTLDTNGLVGSPNFLTNGPSPYRFQLVNHYGIKARLGVPITVPSDRNRSGEAEGSAVASQPTVLAVLVFFTIEARQQEQRLIELVSAVATQLGVVLAQKQAEDALRRSAEREQATLRVIERMRQTLDIEQIFHTTTAELRQLLNCDRVLIYCFNSDWSGKCVAESVGKSWISVLQAVAEVPELTTVSTGNNRCLLRTWNSMDFTYDTYLQETQGGAYSQGAKYLCIDDVQQTNFAACYLDLLDKLQAKAYLTVPIFQGNRLWGLLATYQNSGPRHWLSSEIHLVTHISTQLGVALQQSDLLTQTQRQSADLEKAKDAAEAANRAKTQFLANMSHELRTPLNSVLGFTQLISQEANLGSEYQEYLNIINRSGQHLLDLINNILEVSKLEADRASLQNSQLDLYGLLGSIKEMLSLTAAEKHLSLGFMTTPEVPKYIIADKGKLRQILLNLLDNAIKFTQAGSVKLRVYCSDPTEIESTQQQLGLQTAAVPTLRLHFEVEDTGFGIAIEEIDYLFEAFVQTEAGRQSNRGTGLGLAISRRFIELMGGKIQVRSQLGVGSVFEFDIPVRLAAGYSQIPPLLASEEQIQLKGPILRALVVTVQQEVEDLTRLLSTIDMVVDCATSSDELLAYWQKQPSHLIVVDPKLPGISQTLKTIWADSFQPTIFILVDVHLKQAWTTSEIPYHDILYRPLQTEELFAKLAEHLGVHCIYGAIEPTPPAPSLTQNLVSADLAVMSVEWIAKLHHAARGCSDRQVLQLIEQIPLVHLQLTKGLEELVYNFRFEEIVKLTQFQMQ